MSDETWRTWRAIRRLNNAIRLAEGAVPTGRRAVSDHLLGMVLRETQKRLKAHAKAMDLDADALLAGEEKRTHSQRPKHARRLSGL